MKVVVYGAGAVGGALGARFADGGADVTFIARGAHLEALQSRGLTLVTPEGERSTHVVRAVGDPREVGGPVDVVLFLVKSYDTDAAAARIGPLLHDDTAVLSLQNGVSNEERIAALVDPKQVLGGAVYILAAITEPGVVRTGKARIVVGELQPGPPSERVESIVAAARAGGIAADASSDVRIVKWEKYVLLVGFSAVTAATQLTIGDVRASQASSEMMRSIMAEAWQVGRALGIPLADDLVDRQQALVLAQKDTEATSLRHDLITGHRMELDALQGTLRRLGRETGVATPWTDAAYAILEPWAIRNAARPTA